MMSHDELDRILSREEEILPSSGFAASVMDAVRREAAAPPPIPFPWRRALPLVAAAGVALVLVVVVLVVGITQLGREGARLPSAGEWMPRLLPFVNAAVVSAAGWVLLALALSFASVALSLRLASGRA
jgi:hypothetical protein